MVDLVIGNNVLVYVFDINDFVGGFLWVIKLEGVVSLEFLYLLCLIEGV